MHGAFGDGHMMGWMGWMSIWWILGAVLVAVVVSILVRSMRGRTQSQGDSPEEVLKRRYAKGEIDGPTYHRMREELRS